MQRKLAVLVDGSGFIYRAFYGMPPFTAPDGTPVGAVYGFCTMLLNLLEQHRSDLFCVILDSGRKTFRTEIYKDYKANRGETPQELKVQFPLLREACDAFGIPTVEKHGFEADDIIATYAVDLESKGFDVRIISSDKDLMQLVTENITMFDPLKNRVVGINEVIEKYGVPPAKMTYLQALMGDTSDNVPGVKGIGPKTAAKLLQTYETLDGIFENSQYISAKIREKLLTSRAEAEISLKLVTLCRDIDIARNYDELVVNSDINKLIQFFDKCNFSSLKRKIAHKLPSKTTETRALSLIYSAEDLRNFFQLNRVTKFSFCTTSLGESHYAIALCSPKAVTCCIFTYPFDSYSAFSAISEVLHEYFANPNIHKIGFFRDSHLFNYSQMRNYDDIGLMSYLLHGIVSDNIGSVFQDSSAPICNSNFSTICDTKQLCSLAELLFDYCDTYKEQLRESGLYSVYENIDLPLFFVLRNMEKCGIKISPEKLQNLENLLADKIEELEKQIYTHAGCRFKIASVKQLREVLFEKLQLPMPKKNSVDIESLEEISAYSPVPQLVIEWRKLSKLISTYTSALLGLMDHATYRVHTTFNMTSTVTGRLSSSNPNLQNIPVRTEIGKQIKNAFISKTGYKLLSFDYSQIELRVLAHLANVRLLQEAFQLEIDVHTATAANIFCMPVDSVTEEMRTKAKAINFGILYGMSAFRLSNILHVSLQDAKTYLESYYSKYPEIIEYKQSLLDCAKGKGYVETITKRRCYIKDISSSNYVLRQFSERQAVNAAIQGSAADIVKIAMIEVSKHLENLHSSMLLQIHDELVLETENDYTHQTINTVSNILQNVVPLSVPLTVHVNCGETL